MARYGPRRGEVGLIIQPHGYGAGRTYWYETLVRPKDVSAYRRATMLAG